MKIINYIDKLNKWVGLLLVPFIMLISLFLFWEVAARYFLNSPTIWVFELCQMLFVACSILSGGHIHQTRDHIEVDIFSSKFSPRIKKAVSILTFPFFLLFIGSLTYFGSVISG